MKVYTVYVGVTYTLGVMNLDDIKSDSIDGVLSELRKVMQSEPDATNYVISIAVEDTDD